MDVVAFENVLLLSSTKRKVEKSRDSLAGDVALPDSVGCVVEATSTDEEPKTAPLLNIVAGTLPV